MTRAMAVPSQVPSLQGTPLCLAVTASHTPKTCKVSAAGLPELQHSCCMALCTCPCGVMICWCLQRLWLQLTAHASQDGAGTAAEQTLQAVQNLDAQGSKQGSAVLGQGPAGQNLTSSCSSHLKTQQPQLTSKP